MNQPSNPRPHVGAKHSIRPAHLIMEILGSLILLVIANFFTLWYLDRYSTNFGYWVTHQKWNILARMDAPVDWLILGDSSCNQGVSPAIIEQQLGESAVNLCTIGNLTVLSDLWILEEYIQRFGAPKGVLIVHVYDVWERDLNPVLLGFIPRPWGFWEDHTLGDSLLEDPDVRREVFLEHYVPLISQDTRLTNILRSAVFECSNPFEPRGQMEANGFLPAEPAKPELVAQDSQQHLELLQGATPTISSINLNALQAIIAIAETYQFPVYLVNGPLYEGLYADLTLQAYLAQLQEQLETIADQAGGIHLVREVKTFPASELQLVDHLTLPGAEAYTHWLIQNVLIR